MTTKNKDDSGPAFPVEVTRNESITRSDGTYWKHAPQPGMSLRDWFAGQALSARLNTYDCDSTAREAYRIADAMLEARRK